MLVLAKNLTVRNEHFENMQIVRILNNLLSSFNMDATTLRFNETIKSTSRISTTLAVEHDLVNSIKQLELNFDELNFVEEKYKSSYNKKE